MHNDLTYLLAVLVKKEILTLDEAKALQVESRKSITNSSLGEMVSKVDKALKKSDDPVKKIDASTFLSA